MIPQYKIQILELTNIKPQLKNTYLFKKLAKSVGVSSVLLSISLVATEIKKIYIKTS